LKEIVLANDRGVALVDADDYDELSKHAWHIQSSGYAQTDIRDGDGRKRKPLMHRLILSPPVGLVVDHYDGNKLNNRRSNLRIVTQGVNIFHAHRARRDNQAGAVGINVEDGRFRARIKHNGTAHHIGYFDDIHDAVGARLKAEVKFYGTASPATLAWIAKNGG
jgi:hypothetical protein